VPDISYGTFIGNFVIGILFLAIVGMIEFTVLNFCDFTYNNLRSKINEKIEDITFMAKVDDDDEVMAQFERL
jgi:hypothetical protein